MSSVENNGRSVKIRDLGILYASEGAEEVPHWQGRVPPAGPLWAASGGRLCPVGGPSGSPLVSGVFLRIKNLRKFPGNSDDITCGALSEIQKQQKQGTGTGHLVNRLVRQQA